MMATHDKPERPERSDEELKAELAAWKLETERRLQRLEAAVHVLQVQRFHTNGDHQA